jgi:ABC-type uncharacterized transport system substrate-binding protein
MRKNPRSAREGAGRFAFLLTVLVALSEPASALDKKEYRIYVVVDILRPKFQEVIDGFRETLDAGLSEAGAKAAYTVFDTKNDPATASGIIASIESGGPDLILAVNGPDSFADRNVSLKLSDPRFRFVSENCIPIQSGVAREWRRPGGNITGVGVFVQMNSMLKMAKMVDPRARKLIFFSWDRMTEINDWFVTELTEACEQEGIELAEVKYLASAEEEFEFLLACDEKSPEYFGIEGIAAWVHRDGSYADMSKLGADFIQNRMKLFPMYTYDETSVQLGIPAGTCVVWRDLGAQLAEKGMNILQGMKPGDILGLSQEIQHHAQPRGR